MNHLINIITPYKSNKIDLLEKSVQKLAYQKIINIYHIIVCDESCKGLVDSYFEKIKIEISSFYKFIILKVNKKGIYNAINFGLNILEDNSLYLVLGAGDIIYFKSKFVFNQNNDIFLIPYSTTELPQKTFSKIANLYNGIPYCHNAIIFRKNKIRYSAKFHISADYLYFIEYVNYLGLVGNLNIELINSFKVLVETKTGISSNNWLLKNLENLKILYYFFSLKGIIFYLSFAVIRFLSLIFKKICIYKI